MSKEEHAGSSISDELIDSLLGSCDPKELLTEGGLLSELTSRLVERALEGEMTEHLGLPKWRAEHETNSESRFDSQIRELSLCTTSS